MIAKSKRLDLQSQASLRTRKRIVLMLGSVAIIGNGTSVIMFLLGLSNNDGRGFPVISTVVIALAVVMVGLAIYNRVELAGFVFCMFGVGTITITLLPANLPTLAKQPGAELDAKLVVLYPLLILFAGTVVSARAAFIIGVTSILCYLSSSIYFITLVPPPAPTQLGNTTAFNTGILIAFTVIIYIFSRNLTVIAQTARRQAAELQDANTNLQRQRQLEGSINRQIGMLSSTLGTVFRQQTNTTREQVSLVSEVASTTQELDAAARRIADSALSVAIVAEKALKSAQSGQQAANDGINAITSLRYQVENITESVRYLSNQIERISEVTDIIGEIADETNLLALNATIEAAGAREYGRRFAAVAEEVSRLSRRASLSVEQIQDLVEEVTSASSRSIAATEAGLKQALQGTDLVNRLSDANEEVILLVNQTSALAASIANATQQQRTASEQIVLNIDRINETANGLATTAEDVNRLVANLETSTEQLVQTEMLTEDAELSVSPSADGGQSAIAKF